MKVVEADAGGYRCEVTAKDKCDSCAFEITVEGTKNLLALKNISLCTVSAVCLRELSWI